MLVLRTEGSLSKYNESGWLLLQFVNQPVRRLLEPGGVVRRQRKVERASRTEPQASARMDRRRPQHSQKPKEAQ